VVEVTTMATTMWCTRKHILVIFS